MEGIRFPDCVKLIETIVFDGFGLLEAGVMWRILNARLPTKYDDSLIRGSAAIAYRI